MYPLGQQSEDGRPKTEVKKEYIIIFRIANAN
jgi:hypothetical protein